MISRHPAVQRPLPNPVSDIAPLFAAQRVTCGAVASKVLVVEEPIELARCLAGRAG